MKRILVFGHAISSKVLCRIILSAMVLIGITEPNKAQTSGELWKLVWQDEFENPGLPDFNRWNFDTAGNKAGWGNREAQWYTATNPENAFVSDGLLHITARKKPISGKQYTSARLTTKGKGDWLYGKIEVRAKLPKGIGSWPAIWMLPSTENPIKWPDCGEIDIMEHIGSNPDSVLSTIHTLSYNHLKGTQKGESLYLPKSQDSFHTYVLEWSEKELIFTVNEYVLFRYPKAGMAEDGWPFDKPFHLILNLAIGGNFGGKKGIDDSSFPQVFQIDYVRVYQKEEREIIQRPQGSGNNSPESRTLENMPSKKGMVISYSMIDGLLSINTNKGYKGEGWNPGNYYTGKGMQLTTDTSGSMNQLQYKIQVSKPGTYQVFALGSKMRNAPEKNRIELSLEKPDGKTLFTNTIDLKNTYAPYWMGTSQKYEPEILWAVSDTGTYLLNVKAIQGHHLYLEKIVLSGNGFLPEGTGPALTLNNVEDTTFSASLKNNIILPPAWAFGVLYGGYTNQESTLQTIDSLRAGNFPIDAYWIDSWFWNYSDKGRGPKGYLDFKGDLTAFPDLKAMWQEMENRKIKGGIWMWDCILREKNETAYDSFLKKGFFTNSFINGDRWHNSTGHTITGNIDFENQDAVAYWKQQLKPFFDAGLDFLKLDRSSEIPFTKAAFEATQQLGKETKGRGFVLSHLHTTYDPRHKLYPTKWTGDAKIAWSQPDYPNNSIYAMGALKENVGMIADPKRSTYEIPFLTHDAGGYDYFGSTEQSDELYMRWIQFSSLNSIMTLFSQHTNPTRNLPHRYPKSVQDNFKKYTHLRMQLFPYLYTQALSTHLTGTKMVQGDGIHEDQFLLGSSLLVAPVVNQGVLSREVYFPPGIWYDADNDVQYKGDTVFRVQAPMEKLPLFIKKGSILPKRDYAPAIELGNNERITLEIYPDSNGSFSLLEDDGISNQYLSGGYAETKMSMRQKNGSLHLTIGKTSGGYQPGFSERTWVIRVHDVKKMPRQIQIQKKRIRFEYQAEKKQLVFGFKGGIHEAHLCEISGIL